MRKHKSVVAILLAVMMIFTFMPTMAFATTTVPGGKYPANDGTGDMIPYDIEWSDNFDKATINGVEFDTIREMADAQIINDGKEVTGWNGRMKATIDFEGRSQEYARKYSHALNSAAVDTVYYYDMDFAATGAYGNPLPSETPQFDFEIGFLTLNEDWTCSWHYTKDDVVGHSSDKFANVFFYIPDYIEGYTGLSKATKKSYVADPEGFNWNASLSSIEDYKHGDVNDQNFTIKTTLEAPAEGAALIKGSVADKAVKVTKNTVTPRTAKFFIDSTDNAWSYDRYDQEVRGLYDGAEHTLVVEETPGWTVSYSVFNSATSKYDAVDAVKIKDVQKKDVIVKATFKQAGRTNIERVINLNLDPAEVYFGFDETQSVTDAKTEYGSESHTDYNYDQDGKLDYTDTYTENYPITVSNITYEVSGSDYNAMDYVVVTPFEHIIYSSDTKMEDKYYRAYYKALNAANKAAVEANKTELNSFLNDCFEVKATPSKADPNTIALKLQEKSLSFDEQKALEKKYEALFNNFYVENEREFEAKATMKTNVAPENTKDDHIAFTGTTKYAYKAKKSNKKLAKTKSIKVNTKTDSGNAVEFTYTSNNKKVTCTSAGTIKVKKGLKKGTYKITVEARTKAGNGYKAAAAKTKTYTIKIK